MILWFAGMSLVSMWVVFRDPAIDHRLVLLGALMPDLVDVAWGHVAFAHTLIFAVGLLFVVMGVTVGRRLLRRRLLAVPIGWFLHLVFDGVWSNTSLFWWPVNGVSFDSTPIPAFDRPLGLVLVMELVGIVALTWVYRRFGLGSAQRRAAFVQTGRIDRALTNPDAVPPSC